MIRIEKLRRGIYAVPVVGRITREVAEGDADNKWYLGVTLLTLWVLAGMTWGLPAVVFPFVALAPLCLIMLVALTRG